MEHHLRTGDWGKLRECEGQLEDSATGRLSETGNCELLGLSIAEQN
jgi:hypothetical protein